MRDFSKVSPAIWHSSRFNSLASDDARYLLLYLITNEHQNSAGCYRLPDGYACSDLRWAPARYLKARKELEAGDLIAFDPECNVVMVRRWFRHNAPMNQDHYTGICRVLERLPSEAIAGAAQTDLDAAWESIQAERAAKGQKAGNGLHAAPEGLAGAIPKRQPSQHLLPKGKW